MSEGNTSWGAAVAAWQLETIDKSPAVAANEVYVLKALASSFGILDVGRVDEAAIARHCRARLDAGRMPRTINRDLRIVRAILRSAQRRGELATLPRIRMLKVTTKRLRWITFQQSRALLEHLPSHLVPLVAFSLETGLRKSNVAALRWEQVDIPRAVLWVHPDQAKARRAIGVPLSEAAVHILKGQLGQHPHHVFTYRGRGMKNPNGRAYRNALAAAGIENFRWHDLRHTWASWHAQNGTPMNYLQELGSWSDPGSVMIYAHLSLDHLRRHVTATHDRVRDRHLKGGRPSVRERSD